MSDAAAAASVTAMTGLSVLGRLGLGNASDACSNRNTMTVAFICVGIAMLLFSTVNAAWQLVYVLTIFGIGHGGVIPVRSSLYAEYFGLRALGSIQGLGLTTQTIGGFLGPVLAGILYDQTDSYRLAFLLLGIAPLLAVPLVMSTKRPRWKDADETPVGAVVAG
jgi:MFS family permease